MDLPPRGGRAAARRLREPASSTTTDQNPPSINNWTELPDENLTRNGYQNIIRGWRNTITGAEVLAYRVEGADMEDVTNKEFAVQHPTDDDGEHTYFFDEEDEAKAYTEEYMNTHASPDAL